MGHNSILCVVSKVIALYLYFGASLCHSILWSLFDNSWLLVLIELYVRSLVVMVDVVCNLCLVGPVLNGI